VVALAIAVGEKAFPSGDQLSNQVLNWFQSTGRWFSSLPSGVIRRTFQASSRCVSVAIHFPSGDQCGSSLAQGSSFVMFVWSEPSAFMT